VTSVVEGNNVAFSIDNKTITFFIVKGNESPENTYPVLFEHQLTSNAGTVLSKLKLNKRIFARNCQFAKIDKALAMNFLRQYHLLGATGASYCRGLYHNEKLLAVSTFSKGRRMNRLAGGSSFELIRFCCLPGVTVIGGLSRLVKSFCREKNAGDIMSYVDKALSDGTSFSRAGFRKHSESAPVTYLINENKDHDKQGIVKSGKSMVHEISSRGNIKMIFNCEKLRKSS
jgi:hypothetical protein